MRPLYYFAAAFLLCPNFAAANAQSNDPNMISLSGDYIVTGVMDGQPISLVVDGTSPDKPLLNPGYAKKSILASGVRIGQFSVGPTILPVWAAETDLIFDGIDWRQSVIWSDRQYVKNADGGIGPNGIPYKIVKLELRPPVENEKIYTFPMIEGEKAASQMVFGDKSVDIIFSHRADKTVATPQAAAAIAAELGGKYGKITENIAIAFDVERPTQSLQLAQTLDIVGKKLATLQAIVDDAAHSDDDHYLLTIGRDDLDHCSSLSFDNVAKEIRLSCRPQ